MTTPAWLKEDSEGVRISVRLLPRAAREEIAGERQGALLVRVSAPPVEGRANQALRKLLARRLGVAQGRVEIATGQRSRTKTVRVTGLTAAQVAARLR